MAVEAHPSFPEVKDRLAWIDSLNVLAADRLEAEVGSERMAAVMPRIRKAEKAGREAAEAWRAHLLAGDGVAAAGSFWALDAAVATMMWEVSQGIDSGITECDFGFGDTALVALVFEMPASWKLEEVRLALEPGGPSLVRRSEDLESSALVDGITRFLSTGKEEPGSYSLEATVRYRTSPTAETERAAARFDVTLSAESMTQILVSLEPGRLADASAGLRFETVTSPAE